VRGDIDKEVGRAYDIEKQMENAPEADMVEKQFMASVSYEERREE